MRDERPALPRAVVRVLRVVLGPAALLAAPDGCRETQAPPVVTPTASPAPPQPPAPQPPAPQPPAPPAPPPPSQPIAPPGTYVGPAPQAPLPGAVPARRRPEAASQRPPRRRARA